MEFRRRQKQMNVSPHHQRPTKYPWPGFASRLAVGLALVVIIVIGFILITDPFTSDDDQPVPTAMGATAAHDV